MNFVHQGRSTNTVSVTHGSNRLESYEFELDPPDVWVSQFAVGSSHGPWTDGGAVEIRRDGAVIEAAFLTDYQGRFGYRFDEPLTPGTEIRVRDLISGHEEVIDYQADFVLVGLSEIEAFAQGSFWPGPIVDLTLSGGFEVDIDGVVTLSAWEFDGGFWRRDLANTTLLRALGITAVNDRNQEIVFSF